MAQHDTYVLHIWRSRSVGGWQWVARVEHTADGQRHRFADPEALLTHLRVVLNDEWDGQEASDGSTLAGPKELEIVRERVLQEE